MSSPVWGSWPDIYYCLTVIVLFLWGALSGERTGLSFVYAAGPCQHLGLATIFYSLRFETSLFVASYDSQGRGGGIRPRLHTGITPLATNRLSLYCLGSDPMENTVFHRRVLLCYLTMSCSTVHREHRSYCCVLAGMCILTRCLTLGICITVF
jgi:hypothetical protein